MDSPTPWRRIFGCTAYNNKWAFVSSDFRIANPCITPDMDATNTVVCLSFMWRLTRAGVHRHVKPYSTCWREIEAISAASEVCAMRRVSDSLRSKAFFSYFVLIGNRKISCCWTSSDLECPSCEYWRFATNRSSPCQ